MKIDLKRPCGNCPFLKVGAIDLHPGRLRQIVDGLLSDDRESFICHKTISGDRERGDRDQDGGDHDAEDSGPYKVGPRDQICAGSMAFLLKAGAPNVAMRMAAAFKMLNYAELDGAKALVIEPEDVGVMSMGAM